MRNALIRLVGRFERRCSLGRRTLGWGNNIKTDIKE
jgi:hypothetical protein